MKNILFLGKCAYIFHTSNNVYFYGTKADREKKNAINHILKSFYDDTEKLQQPIPYTIENDNIYITLDGYKIRVNAAMIAFIFGDYKKQRIINNRTYKDLQQLSDAAPELFHMFIHKPDSMHLYSNRLKTFNLEYFPGENNLNFYRMHYKHNYIAFIISDGLFYNPETLQQYTTKYIADRLNISGRQALKEYNTIINFLKEA